MRNDLGITPGVPGGATAPAPAPAPVPAALTTAMARYSVNGRHAELVSYEKRMLTGAGRLRVTGAPVTTWQYIDDSCEGTGGYSDGSYLVPFRLELESEVGSTGVALKYAERQALCDYDRFPGAIMRTPWDVITSKPELILRTTDDERVGQFWDDCDGNGTPIQAFLEYPHTQARKHGTGLILMDRPDKPIRNLAEDRDPANRPRAYKVPTSHVHDWKFHKDGELDYLILAEPEEGQEDVLGTCTVRVWTRKETAIFRPAGYDYAAGTYRGVRYEVDPTSVRVHGLGRVPVVRWHNDQISPGRFLAPSEMFDVSRKGQTVFNMESEIRAVERQCASPFLTVNVGENEDLDPDPMVIGTEAVLVTRGGVTPPAWVQMNMDVISSNRERQTQKKGEAWADAGLRAIVEEIQTTSGEHAEVEFTKTERRIGAHAGEAQRVETELVLLYLLWLGERDRAKAKKLFSVAYPREFGIRDMERIIKRTTEELMMVRSPEVKKEILEDYLRARFPSKDAESIQKLVDAEIAKHKEDDDPRAQLLKLTERALATGKKPPAVPAQGGNRGPSQGARGAQ